MRTERPTGKHLLFSTAPYAMEHDGLVKNKKQMFPISYEIMVVLRAQDLQKMICT